MKKVIDLFIKNKILTNWIMLLILAAGVFGMLNLKKRIWPAIEFDYISVNVGWPGASAREVEDRLIIPVEDQLMSMEGIESVYASAGDGWAYFGLTTDARTNKRKIMDNIDKVFQTIDDYPADARRPSIVQETQWNRVMLLFIYGEEDQDPALLEEVAQEFKEELLNTGEASEINMWGFPQERVIIELTPEAQSRYNISLQDISNIIQMSSLDASSGSLLTGSEQIELRQYDKKRSVAELEDIPITTTENGRILRLGDICTIDRRRGENSIYTRANGRIAMGISIMYSNTEDVIALGEVADEMIAEYQDRYQGLLHFEPYIRDVDDIEERLGTLTSSGLIGLLLVLVVLGIFLNIRLSFWVALGIPISFFGLLFIEWIMGITINEMSLFGMIMVIGILVDDGIVIGENIFRHRTELGKSRIQAALDGTMEVLAPICVSIATTMVAFAPYFFLYGDMGKYTSQIGIVVIISLAFSLVEALILLPAHLAHGGFSKSGKTSKLRDTIEQGQNRIIQGVYRPLLEKSLKNRGVVIALLVASIAVMTGAFMGNHIRSEFFPELDAPYVYIEAKFPAGTPGDERERIRQELEQRSQDFGQSYARPSLGYDNGIVDYLSWDNGDAVIVYLLLIPNEDRDFSVKDFGRELNQNIGSFPELESLIVGEDSFFGGSPISVRFLGKDQEQLQLAGDLFKAELQQIEGVKDIRDDLPMGNRELVYSINDRGRAMGFNEAMLAQQLGAGFSGIEVLKFQEGFREIPVMLQYPQEYRDQLQSLENMPVQSPMGQWVSLETIADFDMQRSLMEIVHKDGYRALEVNANLDSSRNDLNVVNTMIQDEILPRVLAQVEGVTLSNSGQAAEVDKMVKSMIFSMAMALLFMFTLLMFQMRSYGQTITVLMLIPLGIIGAVLGHGIIGIPLSFISFLGCIALGGIIVNDSVVLIDAYNRMLKEGKEPRQAVVDAAVQRFRPIMMTTLTTAIGLAPLILQKSTGGQMLIPIAVSICFGLIFGTFLTLMFLPAILSLMTEAKLRRQARREARQQRQMVEAATPEEIIHLERLDA